MIPLGKWSHRKCFAADEDPMPKNVRDVRCPNDDAVPHAFGVHILWIQAVHHARHFRCRESWMIEEGHALSYENSSQVKTVSIFSKQFK